LVEYSGVPQFYLGSVNLNELLTSPIVINRINENELRGYLVFENDKPIGWCNANNRSNYQRLLRDYDLIDNPDDEVCSIVCFLIHPDYRRQNIATSMFNKLVLDWTGQNGIKIIWLQVEAENRIANKLYTKLGMKRIYSYYYMEKKIK